MNAQEIKKVLAKKHITVLIGAVALLVFIAVMLVIFAWSKPARSVTAFCNTFKQEDARLAKSYGDSYGLHPFTHDSNNPHDFVVALKNLDAVAPTDIEPSVKTLKLLYEKIDSDPSQALSVSLSGFGPESDLTSWTSQHCH
jgi:hypothetical protein